MSTLRESILAKQPDSVRAAIEALEARGLMPLWRIQRRRSACGDGRGFEQGKLYEWPRDRCGVVSE